MEEDVVYFVDLDETTEIILPPVDPMDVVVDPNTYEIDQSDFWLSPQILAENIEAYTVVSATPAGLVKANPFDLDTWNVEGIALRDGLVGSNVIVKIMGQLTNPAWNWDLTRPIFVGTGGQLTQYALEGAAYLARVATPLTPQSIIISIDNIIVL